MLRYCVIVGLLIGLRLPAQVQTPDEPLTLHAYVNLVQIPVLVLSSQRLRAERIAPDHFTLSIDSGPRFAPQHVRQEGSDPIRLVVLLDVTQNTRSLIDNFGPALRDAMRSFTESDELSLSVVKGNALVQTAAMPVTAATVQKLSSFMAGEMRVSGAEPGMASETPTAPRLLDVAELTLKRFGDTRSRRVLLLITDGEDRGSRTTLEQLHRDADSLGVTVFALREQTAAAARKNEYVLNRDSFAYAKPSSEAKDALATMTNATGGLTLEMRGHPLAEGLMRVLRLVRERYIVDFRCPSKLPAGVHTVDVRVREPHLWVRWSGIGVPLPDPNIAKDPNTVPSDTSVEPPFGTRRVLTR